MASGDVKLIYATGSYTITLASLATSSTLLVGREGTAVSNTTNLYEDYLVSGFITTGTSPAAGVIEVWAYAEIESTPTYPDVLDGTDSAETLSSTDIKWSGLSLVASIETDTTSDRTYPFKPVSLVDLFGHCPRNHGVFATHSTVAALNSTPANHSIDYVGVYRNVAP